MINRVYDGLCIGGPKHGQMFTHDETTYRHLLPIEIEIDSLSSEQREFNFIYYHHRYYRWKNSNDIVSYHSMWIIDGICDYEINILLNELLLDGPISSMKKEIR